jgi:2-methylcitrate dehydratase PrpD
MSSHDYKSAQRPSPDELLVALADYTRNYKVDSLQAYETAKYCLMDTLACGFQALKYPACTRLLGPVVPGATLPGGSRVPGTSYELDPVMGAFNIGAMVRWLDFNDTWLAAEWGHPSDNLGAILAVADYLSRAILMAEKPLTVRDVLTAMIKAHDPGCAGAGEQLQPRRLDHVLLVRVASTGWPREMLGGSLEQIVRRSRMPGSMAGRCALIAMRRTRGRARAGRRATPPAAPCVTRCSRSRTRWDIRRR